MVALMWSNIDTLLVSLWTLSITLITPFWIPFMLLSLWLWFRLFSWFVFMFMCDIWTLFDRNYRGAFTSIRSMFFHTLRQNSFLPANFLPFNFLLGCILVHDKQVKELPVLQGTTDAEKIFVDSPSWMSLGKAKIFMEVAMSMYGWKFVLYRHIKLIYPFGLLKFILTNIYCFFNRPKNLPVKGDLLRRNLAAVISQSHATLDDFTYVSFIDGVYKVPFCVLVDRETKSILISIRGSLSFDDWITDFTTDPKPVYIEGVPYNHATHKGMWKSARYVQDELEDNGIIEKLLAIHEGYNLVVTGHSLGAGASVLLGIQLRKKYPQVKVYAFSCPGWLVDETLAEACKDFVFVVGLGDDIVLRAGTNSATNLVDRASKELKKTTWSFIRILFHGFKFVATSALGTDHHVLPVMAPIQKKGLNDSKDVVIQNTPVRQLYLPGNILHLVRVTETTKDGHSKKYFAMRWGKSEEFTEILVMPRMFTDHEAQNVMQAIDTVYGYQKITNQIHSS